MKVEVREESVVVSGYVNAVERYSKPIRANIGGEIRSFIEKIKAGTFKTALKRNNNVKVLLNHDTSKELANTKDGTAKLEEDNIGLRAEVTITDAEVVEKAKNNKLVGWSFGFCANKDEFGTDGETETRNIEDLDLLEVSILDDTKNPAYYGTSIEARSEDGKTIECRATLEEIEIEASEKHKAITKEETSTWEETEKEHQKVNAEKEQKKMELFAEILANKIYEKFNVFVQRSIEVEKEKREIDYSSFEERLANLK